MKTKLVTGCLVVLLMLFITPSALAQNPEVDKVLKPGYGGHVWGTEMKNVLNKGRCEQVDEDLTRCVDPQRTDNAALSLFCFWKSKLIGGLMIFKNKEVFASFCLEIMKNLPSPDAISESKRLIIWAGDETSFIIDTERTMTAVMSVKLTLEKQNLEKKEGPKKQI